MKEVLVLFSLMGSAGFLFYFLFVKNRKSFVGTLARQSAFSTRSFGKTKDPIVADLETREAAVERQITEAFQKNDYASMVSLRAIRQRITDQLERERARVTAGGGNLPRPGKPQGEFLKGLELRPEESVEEKKS